VSLGCDRRRNESGRNRKRCNKNPSTRHFHSPPIIAR
jgi:hypothetical protein